MGEAQHTPKPWVFTEARQGDKPDYGTSGFVSSGDFQYAIAAIYHHSSNSHEANAHLIASAPELLEDNERLREVNAELLATLDDLDTSGGVEYCVDGWRDQYDGHSSKCLSARAAIAKARGQTGAA